MEKSQPAGQVILKELPKVCTNDYVNALILNESGQALVFEEPKLAGAGVHWHLLGRCLSPDTDPFTVVQQELLQKTGYETTVWSYLGSHIMAPDRPVGVGYFFCARQARRTITRQLETPASGTIKWVPLKDLRYALLDGRIAVISHALTASLAFLTILK